MTSPTWFRGSSYELRKEAPWYRDCPVQLSPSVWFLLNINRCVKKEVRYYLKTGKRDLRRVVDPAPGGSAAFSPVSRLADPGSSPSAGAIRREEKELILKALDELEAGDREILDLQYKEGLGNAEVARKLGLSRKAADQRRRRALMSPRESPQESGPAVGGLSIHAKLFLDVGRQPLRPAVRGVLRAAPRAEPLPVLERELAALDSSMAERIRAALIGEQAMRAIAADRPIEHPTRVGGYRIERFIGAGGMGRVYEAVHEPLTKARCSEAHLARIPAERCFREGFQNEAQLAAKLHHTNIVPVFDFGSHEDDLYYAMDFIRGDGLDRIIEGKRARAQSTDLRSAAAALEGRRRSRALISFLKDRKEKAAAAVEGRRGRTRSPGSADKWPRHWPTPIPTRGCFTLISSRRTSWSTPPGRPG